MAAGLGFKTFTSGEVLTAANVNGYLMQGINVFASTAARDAAITVPAEGQFAFTKDTNSLWYYDGAAWVASGATGDIEGVTAGVGISGGGTSGTVTVTNSMATAIDAKGDLVPGTGADTFARLAVGANGTVLTADSADATGLKWAAPAAAGKSYSLLSTNTISSGSTTYTVSGLSGYDSYIFQIRSASTTTANSYMDCYFNGDGGTFWGATFTVSGPSSYASNSVQAQGDNGGPINLGSMGSNSAGLVSSCVTVTGALSTGWKGITSTGGGTAGYNDQAIRTTNGVYRLAAAITSFTVRAADNFDAGTVYIYGSVA